jgi:hypothetical protein
MSTNRRKLQRSVSQGSTDNTGRQTVALPRPAHQNSEAENFVRVSSNWSDPIVVSDRELAVLELYLADVIDQLIDTKQMQRKARTRARGPPS